MSCERYKNKSRTPLSDLSSINNVDNFGQVYKNKSVLSKLYVNVEFEKENIMNHNLNRVKNNQIVFETPKRFDPSSSIRELNHDIELPLNGDRSYQGLGLKYLSERTISSEKSFSEPDFGSINNDQISVNDVCSSPITLSSYDCAITPIKSILSPIVCSSSTKKREAPIQCTPPLNVEVPSSSLVHSTNLFENECIDFPNLTAPIQSTPPLDQHSTPIIQNLGPKSVSTEIKQNTPPIKIDNLAQEITPEVKTIPNLIQIQKKVEINEEESILQTSYVSEEMSPEMFTEEEMVENTSTEVVVNHSIGPEPQKNNVQDRKLLRRLHRSFKGILPPPYITNCKLTIENILDQYYQNEELWLSKDVVGDTSVNSSKADCSLNDSLNRVCLINCKMEEATDYDWPKTSELRYHGLHYNRSKVSEEIEHLCMKYSERYVGSETASSCTIWKNEAPNSTKKRQMIRKQQLLCKSPGSRLSHLAKRRMAFSKENLCQSSVLPSITTNKRQVVFNVKKTESMVRRRLSPRKRLFSASPRKKVVSPRKKLKMSPRKQMKSPRKTPRKTPKKTPSKPSSSTKKSVRRRLLSNYEEPVASCYPGISSVSSVTSTSSRSSNLKRALFQSPDHDQPRPSSSQSIQSSPRRVAKLSRTLFTAPENEKKRKRSDCEEDFTPQREKFARSFSTTDVVPCKVQKQTGLQRRNTEITLGSNPSGDFSEHHKKKMLWAISTALRTQKIGMSHPKFKTYAAALSQLCRKLLSDLLPGAIRIPGSVNERMSKLVHQHVYAIVKGGKTVEEIVEEVKSKTISMSQKPKGYVPLMGESSGSQSLVNISENVDRANQTRIKRQISFDKFD